MYPRDATVELKGVIFMVHGYMDYAARWAHYAEIYSKLGYDVFIMDSRGHGKSEGQSIYVPSVNICV